MSKTKIGALCAAVMLCAASAALPGAANAATPGEHEVEVLGQAVATPVIDAPPAVVTIHGLARIEGASVLYYSMAVTPDTTTDERAPFATYGNGNANTLSQNGTASNALCAAAAIDLAGGVAYTALRVPSVAQKCIATDVVDSRPDPGSMSALMMYVVLAPIPDDVETVDVFLMAQLIQDIPVTDGLFAPVSDEKVPAVGLGWPKVETSLISQAEHPERAVMELQTMITDRDTGVSESETKTTLSLDASVLFALDDATLSPDAAAAIDAAVAAITEAGANAVSVAGHTDSTDTDAYNLDLSERRAAAVAAALTAKIPGLAVESTGYGESEPIADNGTEEGRALNRRVTITMEVPE